MAELVTVVLKKLLDEGISKGIHTLLHRRLEAARQIFLSQLEAGDRLLEEVGEVDDLAACIFEYLSAAQRGAARVNLRLMAQILVGQIQTPPIYADNFLRWASLVASLSREEVIAISVHYRMWQRHRLERDGGKEDAGKDTKEVDEVVGHGKPFKNGDEYYRTISAMVRTGLVVPKSGWGSLIYEPSDLMDKIAGLVDIEAALREPLR
jgi:hypothetical protein